MRSSDASRARGPTQRASPSPRIRRRVRRRPPVAWVSPRADERSTLALSCRPKGSLTLHSENGDALHPELFRGAESAIGDELVLDVLLDPRDGESGRFDRAAVGVALGGAADARGPEIGITNHALGKGMVGHDIGDGEAPASLEQARDLAEHPRLVWRAIDDAVRDHAVDAPRIDARLLDVRLPVDDVREPTLGR